MKFLTPPPYVKIRKIISKHWQGLDLVQRYKVEFCPSIITQDQLDTLMEQNSEYDEGDPDSLAAMLVPTSTMDENPHNSNDHTHASQYGLRINWRPVLVSKEMFTKLPNGQESLGKFNNRQHKRQIPDPSSIRTPPITPFRTTLNPSPINPDLDAHSTGAHELRTHPVEANKTVLHSPEGIALAVLDKYKLTTFGDYTHPNSHKKNFQSTYTPI